MLSGDKKFMSTGSINLQRVPLELTNPITRLLSDTIKAKAFDC